MCACLYVSISFYARHTTSNNRTSEDCALETVQRHRLDDNRSPGRTCPDAADRGSMSKQGRQLECSQGPIANPFITQQGMPRNVPVVVGTEQRTRDEWEKAWDEKGLTQSYGVWEQRPTRTSPYRKVITTFILPYFLFWVTSWISAYLQQTLTFRQIANGFVLKTCTVIRTQ